MICTIDQFAAYLGQNKPSFDKEELALAVAAGQAAERRVIDYLGTEIAYATYTDYWPLQGQWRDYGQDSLTDTYVSRGGFAVLLGTPQGPDIIPLRNVPVKSVTAVWETYSPGGAGWNSVNILPAGEYRLDLEGSGYSTSGFLFRNYSSWSITPGSIRIDYQAGCTPQELAGKAAVLVDCVLREWCRAFAKAKARWAHRLGFVGQGAVASEGWAGASVSWSQAAQMEVSEIHSLMPSVMKDLNPYRRLSARLG